MGDVGMAVERIFHEAERVAVSRCIDSSGNLTGYFMPADDWIRFRAHIVAQVLAATPAEPETSEAAGRVAEEGSG